MLVRSKFVGLLVLALFLPAGARAQSAQRRQGLAGIVLDPSGAAVPNLPIALTSASEQRTTRTNAGGEFRFDNLPPGNYRLQMEAPGFEPIEKTIRVGDRPLPRLVLELALARLKEEITVGGQPLHVNTEISGNASAISVERSLLDTLPVLDLDYLAALSRFLDTTPGGGSPSLVVDGMEARNVGVTPSAIQEIKINQNPYTVEYPRWSRRRIEVVTKTGADAYHGTFNFLFRDHHLNARDAFALERPPEQRRIWEGSLFGPVAHSKKASFLLSAMREEEDLESVVFAQGLNGPVVQNVPTPQQNTYFSLRVSHQFTERNAMFWQVNFQDRWQNNLGVGGTVLPEAGAQSRFREDEFTFNHRAILNRKLLSQFRVLIGRYWSPTKSNAPLPRVVVSDAFVGGGAQTDALRTEIHTSITWLLTQTAGKHTLKYGFNVPDWSRRGFSDRNNLLGTFYFGSLDDYRRNRPFAAVVQRGDPRVVFVEKNVGGFFQDEWQVRQNVSLAAGLRYDWQNFFRDTNNFSPRLALAYAPRRSRKTVIRAGAGYFYDRSGPGPIWDILRYNGAHLRRFVIADPVYPGGITENLLQALPTSEARLQSGVELPEILQFSAGFEHQLTKKTVLAVNYVGTRAIYLLRSRDANAPLPPNFAARPDPALNVLRIIESAGRMRGNALEVAVRGSLAPKVSGMVQYAFGKTLTDTGGVNWFPASSFLPRGEWGRADTDRRHQFNLLGTANLHRWLNFGLAASVLSGPPFNITTGRDDNRDGLANDRPLGVIRNTGHGPGYVGLDVRWYREFRLKPSAKEKSPKATVSLDAFNMVNRVNPQNYLGALSSPFFGRAVAAQPPRRLQVGLRFQF